MKVQVMFFASAREVAGVSNVELQLDEGTDTQILLRTLVSQYPTLNEILPTIVIALNEEYLEGTSSLKDGDCVALIPPISGG
ncbi:molybdopterin synthase sulfur carrier subunit [Cymbomonas tetramitiformis]|uniref:Molybdopterin synthase sulfur carrier subunit n=1 Tax=Cymbomonas tetramitiformis TaxID=36881 RepID=A0AAE0KN90_9CHLO|nr:molybdopterin synthase sulfur carrier subunit [Cymbomonas tetramitiformis]